MVCCKVTFNTQFAACRATLAWLTSDATPSMQVAARFAKLVLIILQAAMTGREGNAYIVSRVLQASRALGAALLAKVLVSLAVRAPSNLEA
jgi:hypothetical protein